MPWHTDKIEFPSSSIKWKFFIICTCFMVVWLEQIWNDWTFSCYLQLSYCYFVHCEFFHLRKEKKVSPWVLATRASIESLIVFFLTILFVWNQLLCNVHFQFQLIFSTKMGEAQFMVQTKTDFKWERERLV